MAKPDPCRFCDGEPDDWCPACGSFLCPDHSVTHDPSLDRPCRQNGEQIERIQWCGTFREADRG